MYDDVNPLLEELVGSLIERDLEAVLPEALSLMEAHDYIFDDDELSLDELAEVLEAVAGEDEFSLEEKNLLSKIGRAVRSAAAAYGRMQGKKQAIKDRVGDLKSRWDTFKKQVSSAQASGKEQGYAASRSKWDKKTADPKVAKRSAKAARKAKGAERQAKIGKTKPGQTLKPGQKMVFGNVIDLKTRKKVGS